MVILPVSAQTPRVAVALVAALSVALERLLVSVRQQVPVEMILTLERLVTHRAEVLPLVTVGQPVLGQRRGVPEHLVAQVALLGTHFGLEAAHAAEGGRGGWRRGREDIEEAGGLVSVAGGGAGAEHGDWFCACVVVTGRGEAGPRPRGGPGADGQGRQLRRDSCDSCILRLGDAEQHVIDLAQLRLDAGLVVAQVQGGEVQGGGDGGRLRGVTCSVQPGPSG